MAAAVPAVIPISAAVRYTPIFNSRFPISSIKPINTTRSSHSLSLSTSLSNPQTTPPPPTLPAAGDLLTGAEILVHALERQGVTAVFAYPGGASVEIHQALSRSPTIRTILPRHEQGGIFAAEGYARAAGRPGVCIATSGPGATNLVTGLADAYLDSIPVVAITGQVPRGKIGTDAFQENPTVEMTRSITKHNYIVLDIEEIPRVVKEAFFLASSGRPGPVLIDIPKDVQQQTVEAPNWDSPMRLAAYVSRLPENPPSESELERIVRLIYKSRKPVLYVGGGCVSSSEELRAFVELTRVPVASTLMGLGVFPTNHELSLQMLGIHGCNHANYAVQNCDLLLALGVRFDDRAIGKIESFAKKAKIVHVDIDSTEIGKVKQPYVSICGDVKVTLKAISNLIINNSGNIDFRAWREELNEQKAKPTWSPLPLTSCEFDSIRPDYVIKVLDELTDGEAVVTTGVGLHQMWAAQFYGFKRPRQWLTSGGFGAMGFGLPAAIGAAVANPKGSIIVDIDGDGSFMMNMQELATVKVENLPIKMVILNNQHLGMVVQWEDQFCEGNRAQSYLGDVCSGIYPNLLKASEAFGIPAARVTRNKDVRAAIRTMLETPGPYLLDVIVPHHQHVFPLLPNR